MKRFRKHVKQGVRLALFALAVQLGLSFGHLHRLALQAAPVFRSGATPGDIADTGNDAAGREAARPQSPPSHDHNRQPADNCAICAVVAMANAGLLSSPPLLRLPQALEFLYLATDAEFLHLKSVGNTIEPHVPPAS